VADFSSCSYENLATVETSETTEQTRNTIFSFAFVIMVLANKEKWRIVETAFISIVKGGEV